MIWPWLKNLNQLPNKSQFNKQRAKCSVSCNDHLTQDFINISPQKFDPPRASFQRVPQESTVPGTPTLRTSWGEGNCFPGLVWIIERSGKSGREGGITGSVWPEAFDFWFQLKRAGFDVRDSSLLLYSLPHLDNHIYFLYSDLRLKNLELIIDEQPNKWHQRRRVFLYSGGTFEFSSRLDTFLRWHSNQS